MEHLLEEWQGLLIGGNDLLIAAIRTG